MNEPRNPTDRGRLGEQPPSRDETLLRELAGMWSRRDPVPVGLVDRICFALQVEDLGTADLGVELLQLQKPLLVSGARGGEDVRTVTFGSRTMTVMLSITPESSGFRIDGWVAPGGERTVDVRAGSGTVAARTDISGRFVVEGVPAGHLQLVLHREDPALSESTPGPVVTPALTL